LEKQSESKARKFSNEKGTWKSVVHWHPLGFLLLRSSLSHSLGWEWEYSLGIFPPFQFAQASVILCPCGLSLSLIGYPACEQCPSMEVQGSLVPGHAGMKKPLCHWRYVESAIFP
jgi:hypothetical protein